MTLFAPYDGTPLSTAALDRATDLATQTDEPLVAATVIPRERCVAVDHGWLADDEAFDPERIVARLTDCVSAVAPEADYRTQYVEGRLSSGAIARKLRDIARDVDASVVVMGTENVGRTVPPASTVSGKVAARLDTDLYVVQTSDADRDPLAKD